MDHLPLPLDLEDWLTVSGDEVACKKVGQVWSTLCRPFCAIGRLDLDDLLYSTTSLEVNQDD